MLRKAALALGLVLSCCTIGSAFAVDARQPARIARIGILTPGSARLLAEFRVLDPFLEGLRDLGYVEGQNLVIEYGLAEGKQERLPDLAIELVRLNVDVILAVAPASARAARNATSTVPVVFTLVGDAVAEGLVASLARPGANLTGVSISGGSEVVAKRMQLLKEAVPLITRMGLLWNPGNPSHAAVIGELPRIAKVVGVELRLLEARRAEDFEGLFASMTRDRIDGLLVLEDVIFALRAKSLAEFLAQNRVPAIYGATGMVEVGGLMSYQTNFATVNRRAAAYVAKILKGARPRDLPVEEPTKFELVINLNTAKALGLTIPPTLLLRADRLIQ